LLYPPNFLSPGQDDAYPRPPGGKIQCCLDTRAETFQGGPEIYNITVTSAAIAVETTAGVNTKTWGLILMIRIRAAALHHAARRSEIQVAISDRHQIYLLPDRLEEAHSSAL
jgi:hypothetical protein